MLVNEPHPKINKQTFQEFHIEYHQNLKIRYEKYIVENFWISFWYFNKEGRFTYENKIDK